MEQKAESIRRTPSTKNRFLGLLKQPTANNYFYKPSPLDELDEGDVFWSTSTDQDSSTVPETTVTTNNNNPPTSPLSGTSSSSSSPRPFNPSPSSTGLSAALSDTPRNQLIQRKTTSLNPSSAVSILPPSNNNNNIFRSDGGVPVVGSYYGKKKKFHQSAPVNVPVWPTTLKGSRTRDQVLTAFDEAVDEDLDGDDDEEMIPPHEIVARSDTTTFSVFEGVGRTLKGRDLTKVRDAVMQKTGFIEGL